MNKCTTIAIFDGVPKEVKKQVYLNFDLAFAAAKRITVKNRPKYRIMPYRCDTCHKIHVGKSNIKLTNEYFQSIKNTVKGLTVIGKIDLSKL